MSDHSPHALELERLETQRPGNVMDLPFGEARARILAMNADDARGVAISLLIQLSLCQKYAEPAAQAVRTDEAPQ